MKMGMRRRNGRYGERTWMRKLAAMPKDRSNQAGEKHHWAKLDRAAVLAIRKPTSMPRSNAKATARRFGISVGYVYQLRARKRWRHI
jgi:hypothetical protein